MPADASGQEVSWECVPGIMILTRQERSLQRVLQSRCPSASLGRNLTQEAGYFGLLLKHDSLPIPASLKTLTCAYTQPSCLMC